MKIESLCSSRSGRPVANQFKFFTDDGVYFQSYDTVIAFKSKGIVTLDALNWDYSRTTLKYLAVFLGQDTATTRRQIKEGIIKLDNLNQ
jgi:hypothetical protein